MPFHPQPRKVLQPGPPGPSYVDFVPDTLRRVAVHALGPREAAAADLVLPAGQPLAELVPSIVDTVFGGPVGPRQWQLATPAGVPLDSSMSLRDNVVEDGDVIVLTTVRVPPPRLLPTDPCAVAAGAAEKGTPGRGVNRAAGAAGIVACAVALVWSGTAAPTHWHLWCAAALSGSAAVGAVAAARAEPELTALLSTAAVVFATAAGLLAVRSAPWPATVLLASSAGFCMSVLLLRLVADRALLTAFTAAGGAATAAAGLANLAASPVTAGAALAALSTAALSVAPKLAVVTAGPEPAAAHSTLTGLVAGWSATAAAGGVTVAAVAGPAESSTILAALFAADLGGLLVLRTRSHVVVHRRIALGAAGSVSLLAAFTVTVVAAPVHAPWLCACAAVLCVLAVRGAGSPASPNPLAHRMIQVTEYAALVALVPLAFWVSGIYGLVRQLSLA